MWLTDITFVLETGKKVFRRYTVCPTRGKPRKMLLYKKNKSTIQLHVIPVMKCVCVLGIRKQEVGNTKR
jgi:hypothetical protein